MSEAVSVSQLDGGAMWRVTFGGDTPGNVIDAAITAGLSEVFRAAAADVRLRVVVLEGRGDHWSYGASVEEHLPDRAPEMLRGMRDLRALLAVDVVTIAVVRGRCLGGGLEIASACHRIVASGGATFGQPEIGVGVFAPFATVLLPGRVGRGVADDLCLSGRTMTAIEALRVGLVNEIASRDPADAALEYARKHLLPRSPSSLRMAGRAARLAVRAQFDREMPAIERLYLDELMQTPDAVEGLRAFLEKRPPVWHDDASVGMPSAVSRPSTASPQPLSSPFVLSEPAPHGHGGLEWESLVAGRWFFRVGLLAMAVGVAYALKLAIDNDWIGPSGQVTLGLLAGAAFIAGGIPLLRRGYNYFAEGLTGLGIVILYLSLWAGGSYYHLYGPPITFGGMVLVTAGAVAIAIGRDTQRLALLALLGGFITPILVSTGESRPLVLFPYLAILNAGLLPVAWFRRWRWLELPALVLTQLYGWGWFVTSYRSEQLLPTIVFASLFFAQFTAVPILQSRRAPGRRSERDAIVVLNAGLYLLALRTLLWPDHRWALTAATLALAALHLWFASLIPDDKGRPTPVRLLFGGIALTLVTLAVPIRLDGNWITVAWAAEAALLGWAGVRTNLVAIRGLGLAVPVLAIWSTLSAPPGDVFLLNTRFLGDIATVAAIGATLWLARGLAEARHDLERSCHQILGVIINILAVRALTLEVGLFYRETTFVDPDRGRRFARELTRSILWILYASGLIVAGLRWAIAGLRWQGLVLFGLTTLKVFIYDLSFLTGIYRVVSSIALGAVLLVISFLYQRTVAPAPASTSSS